MNETPPTGSARTPLVTYALVAALCALIGFGAVYAIRGGADNSGQPAETASNPLSTGDMAAFVFKKKPEAMPVIKFQDATGAERTLAEWNGKVVLLNLWATWCAPCRKEMPALDRLQKALGGDRFEVVALSMDRQGVPAARKFLDDAKVESLKLYVEPASRAVGTLRAPGLPTTILIGKDGREIGRLSGPAEWDGPDARRLIEANLK